MLINLIAAGAPYLAKLINGGLGAIAKEAIAETINKSSDENEIIQTLTKMTPEQRNQALTQAEKTARQKIIQSSKNFRSEVRLAEHMVHSKHWFVAAARPVNLWAFGIEAFIIVITGCCGFISNAFFNSDFQWTEYTQMVKAIGQIMMWQGIVGGAYALGRTYEKNISLRAKEPNLLSTLLTKLSS